MALGGYIKLFRQFSEWEWYKDINTKCLFLHCLISANFKDARWQGKLIKRGQFSTSLAHLAFETGLSVRNVRTALEKLEKTGEIKRVSTSNLTMITVCKFDSYQCLENEADTVPTSDRQRTDKQATSDRQQRKKDKNKEEDKEEEEKYIYLAEFQKIAKGEITRATQLDNNFHFGLFKKEWTENFQNEILKFWRHLEKKKGDSWGIIGTLTGQLDAIKSFLNKFSELEIIESFDKTRMDGNISWNPEWVKNQKDKDKPKEPQGFAYELPPFQNAKQREWWFFQKFEFYKTLEILENRLINTTYYKLAYEKRQPEKLIQQLETEFPNLLDHQFKNDRWQNIQ